jgi:hypothetical protein
MGSAAVKIVNIRSDDLSINIHRQHGWIMTTAMIIAIASKLKSPLPSSARTDMKAICDVTPVASFGRTLPTLSQLTNANTPAATVIKRVAAVTINIGSRVPL